MPVLQHNVFGFVFNDGDDDDDCVEADSRQKQQKCNRIFSFVFRFVAWENSQPEAESYPIMKRRTS